MLTELHEDILSPDDDDYYYIVSECLQAVYSKIEKKLPSDHPNHLNFVGHSQAMWDIWGEIFPIPDTPFLFDHTKESIKEDEWEKNRKRCENCKKSSTEDRVWQS